MDLRNSLGTFLFALFLQCIESFHQPGEVLDCYANNMNPYIKFGSKTAYDFIYERTKFREEAGVPDCTPVQLWLLARHGTRYPLRSELRGLSVLKDIRTQIVKNHEERKNGKLCWADVENLKKWTFNVSMGDCGMLTKQGERDLYFLAKRFKTKFPQLFHQDYSPTLYQFRTTDSERTRQSAQQFADGLFGRSAGVWIPPPVENDTVIKPYKNCSSWQRRVKQNMYTYSHVEWFKNTPDISNLIHNVSQRLGYHNDLPLDTILAMYDMCRYDKAWEIHERSAWCAAFIRHELLLLEYINDLETYYDSGYGNHLNLELGCVPLKDMLQKFSELEYDHLQPEPQPAGVFYFTHRHMLLMTIARLGIAEHGVPLRHDNFEMQHRREWRTSDLSPFGGNLAAVFYKCSSTMDYNKVMFFLNEKKIEYEGCEDGLCSWTWLRSRLAGVFRHCDLQWCNGGPRIQILFIPLIILVLLHRFL